MYSRKKNIPGKQLNELGLFVKILYPKEKNNVKIVNRARILRLSFCIITLLNKGPGEQKMALSNTNQSLIFLLPDSADKRLAGQQRWIL